MFFPTRSTRVLLLAAAPLMAVAAVQAQSNYGAVRGIVTDAVGANVSGATVTLTSTSTKIARTTSSNGSGEYTFSAVEPGTYDVSVMGAGFKMLQSSGVRVDSGNTIPLDLTLQVGAASESVEVSAEEALVSNGTSFNGQLIDSQKLTNLPNAGRNPFLFSKLDNNVTPVGDPRFVRFQDQSGSSTISIAGAPLSSNNYLIDGIPITDFSNRAVIIPSIEATEEVKVQANTYDGEIGRTSGGNFNTTLHTGSSRLHGVLQGETRQTNWGANLFFNNRNGVGRQAAEFYSYVGSLSGPIPLPNFLGGRDKTFFSMTEEGYRQRSPLTDANSFAVPTPKMLTGDFSEIGNGVYNAATKTCGVGTDGKDARCIFNPATGLPYVGNIITNINPVGQALLNAYPKQNATFTGYGSLNFNGGDTLGDRADEFNGKLTHQFGTRWLADLYYLHYGSKEPGGNALTTFAGSSTSYLLYRKVDAFGVQNTVTLTPTTILTVGFGFNRFPNDTQDISRGFNQATLGFPASYVAAQSKTGFPRITTDAGLALEGTSNSGPAVYFSRNFVAGVAKSLGKHNVKVGYNYRAISLTYTSLSDASGTFAFDSTLSNGGVSGQGATAASMLLGYPTSGALVIPSQLAITTPYQAGYLQDDWRVTPKLTLNLGFRYEHENGVHERNNHYSVGFDRTAAYNAFGTGPAAVGGVRFAGQNGYPTTTGNMGSHYNPRAGFAFALDDKTVIRGGAGVFYMPLVYSNNSALAPGYVLTNSIASGNPNLVTLSNPYPTLKTTPVGNSNGLSQNIGTTLTVIDQNRRAPLYESYSADLEHQFPGGIVFKLGYVGGHGRNLPNSENINQLQDQYYSQGGTLTSTRVANKYAGYGNFGSGTVTTAQSLLPFPQFLAITDSVSVGRSDYNALDVKVQKQMSRGVTVLAGYTWSSNWDNIWGAYGSSNTLNSGNNGPQDIYDISKEYARATNDIPNRFTISGTWELPFGRGKQFLSGVNKFVDLAIGGWRFNDVTIIQNGGPLAITQSTNFNSGLGNSTQRPTIVAGVDPCYSGAPEGRLAHYFNPAAFTMTAGVGNYGNQPRSSRCKGPGYANTDLSLNKNFHLTEHVNAEFRAEALNAFNTPQFATPNRNVDVTNAGQISGTLGFPRLVQLGGRLTF